MQQKGQAIIQLISRPLMRPVNGYVYLDGNRFPFSIRMYITAGTNFHLLYDRYAQS